LAVEHCFIIKDDISNGAANIKMKKVKMRQTFCSINQDGGQIKRQKDTTVRDKFYSFSIFPTPLVSHWSLPLKACPLHPSPLIFDKNS
jgi:hypothetical protein